MEFEVFQALPTKEVARLVREKGPQVVVFPINGTRRWFILEHGEQAAEFSMEAYMQITWNRQITLYKLFFDHGIETLVTPIFGPELLERGAAYAQMVKPGLIWINENEDLLNFYQDYDVRVRVYGDTKRHLTGTPFEDTLVSFDELAARTAENGRFRLFFGVCAHDAAESVAEIGLNFYREHGRLPVKSEIVNAYYGEAVQPVDIFIGFDRPSTFDMPLIATGNEDLYFTISPSPYMDQHSLRSILYDYLFSRHVSEHYEELSADSWQILADFYNKNRHHILGLGKRSKDGSFWYPLPQVHLTNALKDASTNNL
jgi:tuberculosinol/isotuberculosinol synthase